MTLRHTLHITRPDSTHPLTIPFSTKEIRDYALKAILEDLRGRPHDFTEVDDVQDFMFKSESGTTLIVAPDEPAPFDDYVPAVEGINALEGGAFSLYATIKKFKP